MYWWWRVVIVLLVGAASGCQVDSPIGLAEPHTVPASKNKLSIGQVRASPIRPFDDLLAELAEAVPGFGGLYFDSIGVLHVYLVHVDRAPVALAAIKEFFRLRTPSIADRLDKADVKVFQGRFAYRELNEWFYLIASELPHHGITERDINEVDNRISIGVIDSQSADKMAQSIAKLGIPSEAVTVRIVPPTVISAGLRDAVRPTSAGLQIQTNLTTCTLGYNAHIPDPVGGVDTSFGVFITNSHCIPPFGVVDGTVVGQPTISQPVGYEIVDPPLFNSSVDPRCPVGRLCRYSDAAVVRYNNNATYQFGRSAMTTGWKQFGITGYNWFLGTDYLSPFFLTWERAYLVGRTTGYHMGYGSATCVDVPQYAADPFGNPIDTGRDMLCQSRTSIRQEPGDSGAPVHTQPQNGVDILLFGLNWGGNSQSNVFSPVYYVESELLQASGMRFVPCIYAACIASFPWW
jgi:hypothetical protein